MRKFINQGKPWEEELMRLMGIITNTQEAPTIFPGCALMWKKFGAQADLLSELSLMRVMSIL